MLTIQTVDWVNAVVVPIVIAVAVGIPLAIYTGVVASKLVAFTQAKSSALCELIELPLLVRGANNVYVAHDVLINIFLQPHMTCLVDGQTEAGKKLLAVRTDIAEFYKKSLLKQLTQAELNTFRISRENIAVTRWREICDKAFQDSEKATKGFSARIISIRADYGTIFEFPTIAGYLRRSDCSNCCGTCNRQI